MFFWSSGAYSEFLKIYLQTLFDLYNVDEDTESCSILFSIYTLEFQKCVVETTNQKTTEKFESRH